MDVVKLDLSFKHLGDQGADDISKFLAFSKLIKHLNLSKNFFINLLESNSLGKNAAISLAKALSINKSLEVLELCKNEHFN